MLFGLWMTPFCLRMLGQHEYGLWLVGLQVLTFLLLADFGIVAITPRDVARLTGDGQEHGKSAELVQLVHKTSRIVRYQTLLVTAGAIVIFLYLPHKDVRGPITVALVAYCLSYPFRIYGAVLQGLQDLQYLGRVRIVLWAISAAITVSFLIFGWRLYALAFGWGFNVFAQEAAAFVRLRRLQPELARWGSSRHTGSLHWKDFTHGMWLSVGQLAQLLLNGSDVLSIARVLGASAVVGYNCTLKLATVFSNQPLLLAATAVPGLSQMKSNEPRERVFQVSTSLGQAMLIFSGALFAVVFAVNRSFVSVWVGPQLFGGMSLTALVLLNLLLRHLDLTLAQSLFAFGYEKPMAIKAVADGLVSAGAAFALVHWFGITGAATGVLLGVLLVSLPTNAVLFSREFGVPLARVFAPYVPYSWRVVLACWAGYALDGYFHPKNYFAIFSTALATLAIYGALIVPYTLRTPLGAYAWSIVDRARDNLRVWKIRWSA